MENIKYKKEQRFANEILGDYSYITKLKLECDIECFREALKTGMKNFEVTRFFIDTTKEMTDEIINDDYMSYRYEELKSLGVSEYIFVLSSF